MAAGKFKVTASPPWMEGSLCVYEVVYYYPGCSPLFVQYEYSSPKAKWERRSNDRVESSVRVDVDEDE